jgi:two-component system LytT family sensor kinase
MPIRPKSQRAMSVLAIFVAWTLFGLYSGVQTHYRSALFGRPYPWGRALYMELIYTWIWAALTPGVLWLARKFPFPAKEWLRNTLVHLVAVFGFTIVSKLLWDVFAAPPWAFFEKGITTTSLLKSIASGLDAGTMLYCVVVLTTYAHHYYREFQQERLQASELHRQFTNAQLQALKMQLHPHFLFNALHTISGLVHEDPCAAERMIARLSDFLRLSLEDSGVQQVTLDDELRFVDLYLDIERVRFDERLTVEFDIDPEARDALVPNLFLQPLVENSIRHGISHRISGGHIVIVARREQSRLLISVADNGPGTDLTALEPLREGVGLSNTRARLRQLYDERQQLTLCRPTGGGVEVRILIPFETGEAEPRLVDNYARVDRG